MDSAFNTHAIKNNYQAPTISFDGDFLSINCFSVLMIVQMNNELIFKFKFTIAQITHENNHFESFTINVRWYDKIATQQTDNDYTISIGISCV